MLNYRSHRSRPFSTSRYSPSLAPTQAYQPTSPKTVPSGANTRMGRYIVETVPGGRKSWELSQHAGPNNSRQKSTTTTNVDAHQKPIDGLPSCMSALYP